MSNRAFTAVAAAALALLAAGTMPAAAQLLDPPDLGWRLAAHVGAWSPRDALIVGADGRHTRLGGASAFGVELQFAPIDWATGYVGGTGAFSTLVRGTDMQPAAAGSDQVTLLAATAGALLGWNGLHPSLVPTLRIGGGLKGYMFDVDGADNTWRPTADIGIGFRGLGGGPLTVGAEIRYLPSSFDQAALPTRGIQPQAQRQTDLLFSVGIGLRL